MTSISSLKQSLYYEIAVSKLQGRINLPEEAVANPHHIYKQGIFHRFRNPYPSYGEHPEFVHYLKNVVWPVIRGELQIPDTTLSKIAVRKPQWLPHRKASTKLRATWLGHACYYVEFPSGLRVLFDPVFEDRCSPVGFLGPRRFTQPPCDVKDIPIIDAVLISHSHYDHLSHNSVLEIQKAHPKAQFFVGLGLEQWFRKAGLTNVTELDWWEDAEMTIKAQGGDSKEETIQARLSCLPCQHTSGRIPFDVDRDTTLWASWAVQSGDKKVWFGGDTGYRAVPKIPKASDDYGADWDHLPRCPQFKQIGEHRGPFDLGLIPIGAYYPRVAFSAMHANPFDSVEIFTDTKCKRAMGIHWGTWALTHEEVEEPPKILKEALRRKGIPEDGVFDVCNIGESREF
ncbi:hypothetical protein ACHAPV_008532 [Trichoderma viride]